MRPFPFDARGRRANAARLDGETEQAATARNGFETAMPFAYYAKLSAARQRTYRRSDAIETLEIPTGVSAGPWVARIREGLWPRRPRRRAGREPAPHRVARRPVTRVPKVRVRVLAKRPADETGELHGLYEPDDAAVPARITRLDAHGGAPGRRRVQDVPAHARPRALPPPRLRALQAARDLPHRGLLQARVDARERAAAAGECARRAPRAACSDPAAPPCRRASPGRGRMPPLPEERCNRAARRPARLGVSTQCNRAR